jgi:xylitol oxidase
MPFADTISRETGCLQFGSIVPSVFTPVLESRVDERQAFHATPHYFGAKLATRNMHSIAALSAENCTEQMGVPGP